MCVGMQVCRYVFWLTLLIKPKCSDCSDLNIPHPRHRLRSSESVESVRMAFEVSDPHDHTWACFTLKSVCMDLVHGFVQQVPVTGVEDLGV